MKKSEINNRFYVKKADVMKKKIIIEETLCDYKVFTCNTRKQNIRKLSENESETYFR